MMLNQAAARWATIFLSGTFWERPDLCPTGGGRTGFHPAHSRCLCPSASGAATSGGDFAAGQQLPAPGRSGDPCSSQSGSLGGSSASPYSSQGATAVDSDAGGCRGLRHFSASGFGASSGRAATEDSRLGGEPAAAVFRLEPTGAIGLAGAALSPIMGGWLPVERASGIMAFIFGEDPLGFSYQPVLPDPSPERLFLLNRLRQFVPYKLRP